VESGVAWNLRVGHHWRGTNPMPPVTSHAEFRDGLEVYLKSKMMGPAAGGNEVLPREGSNAPSYEYVTGTLYPQSRLEDDGEAAAAAPGEDWDPDSRRGSPDENRFDDTRNSANSYRQSSCGITFTVDSSNASILFKVSAAYYVPSQVAEGEPPSPSREWTRVPFSFEHRLSSFEFGKLKEVARFQKNPAVAGDALALKVLARVPGEDGSVMITASIVNLNMMGNSSEQIQTSSSSYFQVNVEASCVSGSFVSRKFKRLDGMDYDKTSAYLLYSHAPEYAIGHGCAAAWSPSCGSPRAIRSDFMPSFDVLPMIDGAERHVGMPSLFVHEFAYANLLSSDDLVTKLYSLCDGYEVWINKTRELKMPSVDEVYRDVAERQLNECLKVLHRMRVGVASLAASSHAMMAFRHANEAMLDVMFKSKWLKEKPEALFPERAENFAECKWRPFQMAFVLISLTSLVDDKHEDRDICDLLWFPTGGGKTEAYLLLSSFEFFIRRLRMTGDKNAGGGVAVIMRYTLRLLTIDQFIRAARMVVSCELTRARHPEYIGSAPISLGLWLGERSTPNSFENAKIEHEALKANQGHFNPEVGSPCKMSFCPCCNAKVKPFDYRANVVSKNIELHCPNSLCQMSKDESRVGIYVIDEAIYKERPSFLIGTIDKFALLAHKEDVGNIFSTDGIFSPPDIIIQDELHLITGPLGTVASIYEAAIDRLCTRDGVRPKIIASTATIRNAQKQVGSLFARKYSQFPQPLIDARDSYFAVESSDLKKGRRYVGAFCSGNSVQKTLIQASASLLQGAAHLEADDTIKDPYWSLVGYFSTLRELGGAHVKFNEDVKEYVLSLGAHNGRHNGVGPRQFFEPKELASRVPEAELNATRDALANKMGQPDSIDVVLCSNMISVGLDISRLSLMLIQGQPKTTAEYIQASSRVGRASPGLVLIAYNPARSRDRSFYEHFTRFHSSFYAEVEATTVTPGASRARDRALHAAFIILMRHLPGGLPKDSSAGGFKVSLPLAGEISNYLLDRFSLTDPSEHLSIKEQLASIMQKWDEMAKVVRPSLCYSYNKHTKARSLLIKFKDDDDDDDNDLGFETAYQMRNVEGQAGTFIIQ